MRPRLGPIVRGSSQMAVGLGVSGVATLAMVGLASRALTPTDLATFVTWWLTVTLLSPVLGSFEIYLARSLLARSATGESQAEVISQIHGLVLAAAGVVAAIAIPLSRPLADVFFNGQLWAPLAIPLFAVVIGQQAIQRGVAAGRRRFGVIGAQLTVDGILRVACTALVLASDAPPSLLWCAPALAGLMSVAFISRATPGWLRVPRPLLRAVSVRPIGALLVAAVSPVLIGNAVAPWFAAVESDATVVAGLSAALLVSRIPTQLASAAFSPAMAVMAKAVDSHDFTRLRQIRRTTQRAAILLGVVFVALFTAFGPWIIEVYLGSGYDLPRWAPALLAAASAALLGAALQQAALTAQRRWRAIAQAWAAASIAFVLVLALPAPELVRACLAPLVGVAVAVLLMAELGPSSRRAKESLTGVDAA